MAKPERSLRISPISAALIGEVVITQDLIDPRFGHVYHPKYLEVFENQRALYVQAIGTSIDEIATQHGVRPILKGEFAGEFGEGAREGDRVLVATAAEDRGAYLLFNQAMFNGRILAASFNCIVVFTNEKGKLTRVPPELRRIMKMAKTTDPVLNPNS